MAVQALGHGSGLDVPSIVRTQSFGTETDGSEIDGAEASHLLDQDGFSTRKAPTLFHKVRNQKSILALAASESKLFAGTQGGEILVIITLHIPSRL